jgi:hypothetical protein
MNCAELQRVLPDILESACTAEQEAHLRLCPTCAELLSDLNAISQQARLLQGSEEPSPRVWNSIEIALREEGLIREPKRDLTIVHRSSRRWNRAWLLPVAAALVVAFGVLRYERARVRPQVAENSVPVAVTLQSVATQPAALRFSPGDDEQLLEVVSSRSPAMRASYEANLQNVNAYIRDAEQSARTNPNDEEAQQYVMDAYEQKAMVYDMALDRSLP